MGNKFAGIQQLGRALMLPIAVLPIAGLLLRLGQGDMLDIPFVEAAGSAIFDNLGLLFAIGVAVGFAKEGHGAAGLAGAVGFLVAQATTKAIIGAPGFLPGFLTEMMAENVDPAQALSRISVPTGIIMGLIAGALYNKYNGIKLPEALAFFGGRRFVPIATGFSALIVGFILGVAWPIISLGLDHLTWAVLGSGEIGLFLYGLFNRILIVTGLHHILNNVAWFVIGDYTVIKDGVAQVVTGDLYRFFAGDPSAGIFMAGFFPVMMFGLPAACLAMYHSAKPGRRAAVGGMLFSMALTAFLTGVTEPIEFAFMFLAPFLYAIHAVLTGISLVVMDILNVKLGFGFSAGFFDYLLNYKSATNPIMLLPVGAVFAVIYYVVFRAAITFFDLKTPGREDEEVSAEPATVTKNVAASVSTPKGGAAPASDKVNRMIEALGGMENLREVDACTTRLRLVVVDNAKVNESALRALQVRGVVKPSPETVQVIIGPTADVLAGEINAELKRRRG